MQALGRQTYRDFSVTLVDNGSTDGSVPSAIASCNFPVRVLSFSENRGFAVAVNRGIRAADSRYIALLNVDTVPEPDWLHTLVTYLQGCASDVGALASLMVRMDAPHLVDDAGDILSWYGSAMKRGHGEPASAYQMDEEVCSVCAGAALYTRDFFDTVGDFDECFTSYLEDVDLCLRGRLLGYKYMFVPGAVVRHQGHGSRLANACYVFFMTRNRLMLFGKNIPISLLIRNMHRIVHGQFYYFIVYRKPIASLRGYLALIRLIPHIISSRRSLVGKAKRAGGIRRPELSATLGEPSLWTLVKRKIQCE